MKGEWAAFRYGRNSETRPAKRMRTLDDGSLHKNSGNMQAATVDGAPSTVARPGNSEQSEIERLRVAELKRKHEWEDQE